MFELSELLSLHVVIFGNLFLFSAQASQPQPAQAPTVNVPLNTAPVNANMTVDDASQFSINSTFRPVMHSTQHILPSLSSSSNQFAKPKPVVATNKFSTPAIMNGPANGMSRQTSNKASANATASGYNSKFNGVNSNSSKVKAADSVTSSQASYSRDQIERKRLEALQKRQNRLKLKASK